jgi:multidrug efflux pump subunit AcrB
VFLEYSQERLASFGVNAGQLRDVLALGTSQCRRHRWKSARENLSVEPSGEFKSEQELGDVLVPTRQGAPVYLRDLADVSRGYVSPPRS